MNLQKECVLLLWRIDGGFIGLRNRGIKRWLFDRQVLLNDKIVWILFASPHRMDNNIVADYFIKKYIIKYNQAPYSFLACLNAEIRVL